MLEIISQLKLTSEQLLLNPNIPIEAHKYLKPGKNEEGWWTAKNLLNQVINYAIPSTPNRSDQIRFYLDSI